MQLPRRSVLKSIGALTAAAALRTTASAATTKKPNILIFLTDDHGQWLQQAYGNSEVRTPNMLRIANSGVRMTNAYTPTPVCSPARASFFTGRMASQHGIHDWIEETYAAYKYPWLENQTLISELLHNAGYHTGLVGKWHCGEERIPHRGFDYWYSFWVNQYPHLGLQNFSDNGTHVTATGQQAPFFTEKAIGFLKNHYAEKSTAEKPFFLFVGYTDTHIPHDEMPAEIVDLYKDATFRDIPRENFFPEAHGKASIPVNPAIDPEKHKQYYAAATLIDREVGKILTALEATGQLDNTIIIYTGDHGLNAGHHGLWEKGNATTPQNFLEESIRVSCSIAWPNGGIPAGLACDLPVNHCDLFATLLDAAQAKPDHATAAKINSPGRSYLAHLRGSETKWHDAVVCEYGNARMIKQDNYKLILRYPWQGVTHPNEFYDLKQDPRETTNIYTAPEHQQRITALTSALKNFFAQYSEPDHDGLHMQSQPTPTPVSPWTVLPPKAT